MSKSRFRRCLFVLHIDSTVIAGNVNRERHSSLPSTVALAEAYSDKSGTHIHFLDMGSDGLTDHQIFIKVFPLREKLACQEEILDK